MYVYLRVFRTCCGLNRRTNRFLYSFRYIHDIVAICYGDNHIDEDFILLLINSIIDNYKNLRNYPASYDDEMIEADVLRYFNRRKANIANEIIPEMYGRMGAEGLSMLTDAGTTRMWTKQTILSDVTPICEVI